MCHPGAKHRKPAITAIDAPVPIGKGRATTVGTTTTTASGSITFSTTISATASSTITRKARLSEQGNHNNTIAPMGNSHASKAIDEGGRSKRLGLECRTKRENANECAPIAPKRFRRREDAKR
ncbi:membrane protein [Anopheles sinensis]|uniref:Membrane protein n=1 Tax=Anopheles sinensis TaxID=74873 RepID=A0A084VSX3_ANOSI|nr:membrane protein [Anopheles sinensis]